MLAQDKAVAKKIFAFHGIHTPVFAKSLPRPPRFLPRPAVPGHRQAGARGRLDRHRVQRRRQLDPRADGADGLAARQLRLAGADRGVHRGPRDVRRRHRQRQARGAAGRRAGPVEAARRHAAHRRGRSEVGQGHEGLSRHEVGDRHRPARGDGAGAAADGGRRLSGARAARLRPRRHAAAARRPRPRHRGQPEPLAQLDARSSRWRRGSRAAPTRSWSKRSSSWRWRGPEIRIAESPPGTPRRGLRLSGRRRPSPPAGRGPMPA